MAGKDGLPVTKAITPTALARNTTSAANAPAVRFPDQNRFLDIPALPVVAKYRPIGGQ